ncbi:MAG: MFS transporter [Rhodospirillaceae bacterium]|jgi:MFS transporter, DHA1 family, inner membrane transport protein|nr:MFS transporter [Rhodospirillaceae bacterium]MBT4490223.1 MFS transporter [Rhodospirillaceae bacterium]MBT5192526.1 MFS transporter [Rhodospirillaceae bacterium]MBT5897127.1 MFS transporter [Rhodospirillaceae bacterium]MBT6430525.1 MFS transporter [Rhodospirillaceae bacterium]
MSDDGVEDKSWRSLWLSSGAMSIAMLGDALIYVVLPVNADAFGISLAWVGVLLAANRIVRTFSYGMIALVGERIGFKNLCLLASVTAIISTIMYGLFQGWAPLLAARMIWGLSYGALLLATLGYAAADRSRTGARVGVSRAVEQIGPLFALTVGAWFAGIVGPRDVFFYLAVVSCIAALLAYMLPKPVARPPAPASSRPGILPKPDRLDILIFWMGFGVDGVFTMTITIMLAGEISVAAAMLWGGLVMSGRRVAEMVVAPLSGHIADRFGVHKPLIAAAMLLVFGLGMVGIGWLYVGALAIVLSRGALGTLIPAAVALFAKGPVLVPLARNQTWRDVGAAAGPMTTGFVLGFVTPEDMHLLLCAVFLATLLWLMASPVWRQGAKSTVAEKN